MKKAKSTGALIVSLVLAAAMLVVNIVGVSTVGVKVYKAYKGEVELENIAPDVEEDPEMDDFTGWMEPVPEGEYAMEVVLELNRDAGSVYGVVIGYMPDGSTWEYYTPYYPETELEAIQEIVRYDEMYIFNAGGVVIALDTRNGQELWINSDFGGQSIAYCIDEDRTMYLCGYYGPDLCVIDINGHTLDRAEMLDPNYIWPYEIAKNPTDNYVKITFEQGPAGEAASIAYNMVEPGFYKFDSEITLASEMDTWKSIFISHKLDDSMKAYDSYALVHIDADGIPEMIGYGDDCSVVLKYVPQTDDVRKTTFTDRIGYYPGTGVFGKMDYVYENDVGETTMTYYGLTVDGYEDLGTFWYKNYLDGNGAYQYEFKYNGVSISEEEYYNKLMPMEDSLGYYSLVYPQSYSSNEIDQFIMNWNDTSDDEKTWKEMFTDKLEFRYDYEGYKLVDLNSDGTPELFYYLADEYGKYGVMFVCDPQTHQCDERSLTLDDVSYDAATGRVFETYSYGSSATDITYKVENYRIVQLGDGFRMMYDNGTDYYLGDELVSKEVYVKDFPAVLGGGTPLLKDCVSYDEIMNQLK